MKTDPQQLLKSAIKDHYSLQDIDYILELLEKHHVLDFPCLMNGLYPASISSDASITGYANVWVRDNVYVAYAKYIAGQKEAAINAVQALLAYFFKTIDRFEKIIDAHCKPAGSMDRPHVRFNGATLDDLDEPWEHAQNDALGYFLWIFCKLVNSEDKLAESLMNADAIKLLTRLPLYFKTIAYWQDEDSGHWEEDAKIEASSIGVVMAGLRELKTLLMNTSPSPDSWQYNGQHVDIPLLDNLLHSGAEALHQILPSECLQPESKARRYDSALLFLAYPLAIVDNDMAEQIVSDIIHNLQGEHGIRRYRGDSFWGRDFQNLPKQIQTSKHTDREQWLRDHGVAAVPGEEAQWCIFDPIISAYYGARYRSEAGDQGHLHKQITYLNRSLRQITGTGYKIAASLSGDNQEEISIAAFKCPELYFIQNNHYSPNTATPLLWTQANLLVALASMRHSLCHAPAHSPASERAKPSPQS